MKQKTDSIQQTEDEIYQEILEVAADNGYLKSEDPQAYREKVIQDMTSLVRIAKKDPAINEFFHQAGKDPSEALDALLQKAINSVMPEMG